MPEPRVGDHFPTDPTSTEVNEELRRVRTEQERIAERRRREEWDRDHGPLQPADFDRGLGEIEAVSEDDVEIEE
jgi:hypothetical protein